RGYCVPRGARFDITPSGLDPTRPPGPREFAPASAPLASLFWTPVPTPDRDRSVPRGGERPGRGGRYFLAALIGDPARRPGREDRRDADLPSLPLGRWLLCARGSPHPTDA